MVSMGIDGFELLLAEGIPRKLSVVLQGPSGDEKNLFGYQFLAEGLRHDEGALVVLSRQSPEEFRQEMKKLGIDCSEFEEKGALKIVDWYSYKSGRVDGVEVEGSLYKSSQSLVNLEIAIGNATKALSAFEKKRGLLDVLSPALKIFYLDEVYSFSQKLRTKLRDEGITSLLIVEKGMHKEEVILSIHQTFDGVIDIVKEKEDDRLVTKLGIIFIRGVSYEPRYAVLKIHEGKCTLETFPPAAEEESQKIRRVLAKQEELLAREPTNEKVWFSRGALYTDLGNFKEALRSFEKIIELNPENESAWNARANALRYLGREEDASKSYKKALDLISKKIDAEYAGMLMAKFDREEFLESFEKRVCPVCGAEVAKSAKSCPDCGTVFEELKAIPEEKGVLGYLEKIGEEEGVTEEELEEELTKVKWIREELKKKGIAPEQAKDVISKLRKKGKIGLTNGLRRARAEKGLVNGLGRVNGITKGLVNGLQKARMGLTNGLTNGSGFTNGLGSPRFIRESRRRKWKVFLVPFITVILLCVPFFVTLPPPRQFGVDGYFDDWREFAVPSSTRSGINENVDITQTAISLSEDSFYAYVEVEGEILAGDGVEKTDSVRLLIDSDRNCDTGYQIEGLGADYQVTVSGVGGSLTASTLQKYVGNGLRWNAWEKVGSVAVRMSQVPSGRLELGFDKDAISLEEGFLVLFEAQSYDGYVDYSDVTLTKEEGLLDLTQDISAPQTIKREERTQMMSIHLMAKPYLAEKGYEVTIEELRVTLIGTLSRDHIDSVRLVQSGGQVTWPGTFVDSGKVSFSPSITLTEKESLDLFVDVTISDSSPTGDTIGFQIERPDDLIVSKGSVTLVTTAGECEVSYVEDAPSEARIDGGFSEWENAQTDPLNDASGYENADITEYDKTFQNGTISFYVRVGGEILGGTSIPELSKVIGKHINDRDRDSVPDKRDQYPDDFDNDGLPNDPRDLDNDGVIDYDRVLGTGEDYWLNTTIPDNYPSPYAGKEVRIYIGPVQAPPAVTGEDVMRIFVDADNKTSTGYAIKGMGADFLLELRGKNSVATIRDFKVHTGASPGKWSWDVLGQASYANGIHRLEVAAEATGVQVDPHFSAYFQTSGWNKRTDEALQRSTKSLTKGEFGDYHYKYQGDYTALFKESVQDNEAVRISVGEDSLSWSLPKVPVFTDGYERIPLASLASSKSLAVRNRMEYVGMWEDLDGAVQYYLQGDSLKEGIILESAPQHVGGDGYLSIGITVTLSEGISLRPSSSAEHASLLVPGNALSQPSGHWSNDFTTANDIVVSKGHKNLFTLASPYAEDSAGDSLFCQYRREGKLLSLECPFGWFEEATYPVTIDPTVILENNGNGEELGYNVTSGDFNGDGKVDFAVGAPENDMTRGDRGAVFVYLGGSSVDEGWDIMLVGQANNEGFGWSMTSGDFNNDGYDDILVGAPLYNSNDGRAYLFFGGNPLNNTVDKAFPAQESGQMFGFDLASGDLNAPTDDYDDAVISAPANNSDDGAVYVFFGASGTNMDTTPVGKLEPSTSGGAGKFGFSVAVGEFEGSSDPDDDVIVGEPLYDGTNTNEGRIQIFYGGSGSYFDNSSDLTGNPADVGDGEFGYDIAVGDYDEDGDDDVFVGGPFSDPTGGTDRGYFYQINAGTGDANFDFTLVGGSDYLSIGISLSTGAIDASTSSDVVLGSVGGSDERGWVFMLWYNETGYQSNTGISGASAMDHFAYASASGDVSGDGYDDVIIGAPGFSGGDYDGAAFVYYGGAPFDTTSDLQVYSSQNETLGHSMAVGDFNNDSYDDLAVGAPHYNGDDGAVYIYFGSSSGLSNRQPPDMMYAAEYSDELFGWNLTAADFNGDGYDDLLVGAPSNDEGGVNRGRAYIFYGGNGKDMDGDAADIDIEGNSNGEQFGWDVAAGNFDGNSSIDAVISAPTYDTDKGRVYVYSYFTSPTESTPNATLYRGDSEKFGSSLATINYDEDSYDDALVGAPLNDSGGDTNKGVAYIYRGNQSMGSWFPLPGNGGNTSVTKHHIADQTKHEDLSNLTSDDGIYYNVLPGRLMWIYDFDATGLSGTITGAMLYVQYKTDGGYSGTKNISVNIPNEGWIDTCIKPQNNPQDTDASFDMYANGLDQFSEFANTHVRFQNDDASKKVMFDYIKINVTVAAWKDANITLVGQYADDQAGFSVASGDFDDDSSYNDDAVLGAPTWYQSTNDTGAVYIFTGNSIVTDSDGVLTTPDKTLYGPGSTDGKFGWSIASAHGTSGTQSDLLVGAPFNNSNKGAAYFYLGPLSNFDIPDFVVDGEEGEHLGYSVVGADIFPSTYDDLAAGGPWFNNSDDDGRVLISPIPEFEYLVIPLFFILAVPVLLRRRR